MSVFNRFWNATKRTAKKVSDKTGELVDCAAISIKIKNLEAKIDEQYEELGKIVYRDLHTEEDLEEAKLQVIATIDALFDRITELKAAKAEAKAANVEATEDAEKAAEEEAEEIAEESATEDQPKAVEVPADAEPVKEDCTAEQ